MALNPLDPRRDDPRARFPGLSRRCFSACRDHRLVASTCIRSCAGGHRNTLFFFLPRILRPLTETLPLPPRPSALNVDANCDARTNLPLGPTCLLDDADAPAPRTGGVQGRIWGNGVLALVLGAAGFGRVHHAPMNDYAHAAVTAGTKGTKGGVSSKADRTKGSVNGMEPSAAHIEEHGGSRVYSKSLLPGVKSAKGKLRQHPDHIGPVPNPHFEDVVCSKWFVGSLNAIG